MKKTSAIIVAVGLLACLVLSLGAFAADDIVISASQNSSFRSIDATKNGEVVELTNIKGWTEKKESPAIFYSGISADTAVYRYIVLEMKTNLDVEDEYSTVSYYFKTDVNTAFSESKKVSVQVKSKTDDYVTYTFDMAKNDAWTDNCTGIFWSLAGDVKGSAAIRSVKFVEGEPIKRIELTEAEKLTDLPNPDRVIPVSKFTKTKEYSESFTDVTVKDWFYESVSSAYEYGFVNGSSDTTYSPAGTMTVAEAITLASRMHSTEKADGKAEKITSGNPWYQGYVDYAKAEGFLKDGDFDSYTRPIKRYEMVQLFAASLPEETFFELNYVTHIPDVDKNEKYADAVYMFYNAGICMGSDIYGTFNPQSNIKRSEVAAIVDRIANLDHRLDQDLAVKANSKSAYWIVDDASNEGRNTISTSTQSGWDYDIRGSMVKTDDEPPYNLADYSDKEPVTLTRHLTLQDSGVVTTYLVSLRFNDYANGWYIQTESSDGLLAYKLFVEDGAFYALDGGNKKDLGFKAEVGKTYKVKVVTDIDNKTNTYIIDNKELGTSGFANAGAVNIQRYVAGTTESAIANVTMGVLDMYCNFLVNEYFAWIDRPYDWNYEESGDTTATIKSGELVFSGKTGKASATKSFEKTQDKLAAELIMLYPEMEDGFTFALTSGGKNVVSFTTKDGKMYAGSKELRSYDDMMWYMVRINADTATQTAEIKVSGKTIAKDVPFEIKADYIDGILLSSEATDGKLLRIDDVTVERLPEYDDYPSEPVVPEGADDYYIGMNFCYLWKNGTHWGWDNVSPYDENKPYLGWYDDGLVEVADWEIKYLAEHGIDFSLVCWYHSSETPMKTFYGSTPEALFGGFMNAKYSDEYGKFALLWEAGNGQKPKDLEDFKTRFCDFWFEYFFTDDRYMVIDNKLVMSIFGADKLKESMGGASNVREAFDYLRERVRTELGYDDIIIMACSSSYATNTLTDLAEMGIDAVHAYNWGKTGYLATINQTNIANQQKNGQGIIHNVPTLSTGFNNIAWAYTRQPNMTVENMEQTLLWIRDSALDKFEVTGEGDSWKQKFIMLSTWNEYGEGTFMMPAGLNGFGYLDTVRKVFTKGGEHEDVRPDNIQMGRLGHLYPINRELIRPEGYYDGTENDTVLWEEYFVVDGKTSWRNSNSTAKVEDGILKGAGTNSDPILSSPLLTGPLNASEVKAVRVWVDGPVGDSVQIYFQTQEDQTWTSAKGTSAKITKEGMNPVTVDLGACATWKGTITAFRVDPISSKNSFAVEKIQYLGAVQKEKFLINGAEYFCDIDSIKTENDILIPFYPDTGIGYNIGCKYTWDKIGKKLTLVKNGTELVFTMGSDRIIVNGEPVFFETEIITCDGIPMVPIYFIADKFGLNKEHYMEGEVAVTDIISIDEETYESLNSRVENQWEFNVSGDHEGFAAGNAAATVYSGAFNGTNINLNQDANKRFDITVSSPDLSIAAKQYKTLKIRMRHNILTPKTEENAKEFVLVVYFASSAGGLSESRTFKAPIEATSNGEFVEYTFNVQEHKDWSGIINKIRIDPFNNVQGEFAIDYIRFE